MWYNEDDEVDEEETFFVASSPEGSCTMRDESSGCLSSATTSPLSFVGPTVYEMAQKSIAALGDYDESASGTTTTTFDLPRNLYLAAPGLIGMGAPTCADHIRNLHALFNVRTWRNTAVSVAWVLRDLTTEDSLSLSIPP
jgi:hypothetical protein